MEGRIKELQKMIEKKFLKAELKKYSFPRRSSSLYESTNSSFNQATIYNLHSQNKQYDHFQPMLREKQNRQSEFKKDNQKTISEPSQLISPRTRILKVQGSLRQEQIKFLYEQHKLMENRLSPNQKQYKETQNSPKSNMQSFNKHSLNTLFQKLNPSFHTMQNCGNTPKNKKLQLNCFTNQSTEDIRIESSPKSFVKPKQKIDQDVSPRAIHIKAAGFKNIIIQQSCSKNDTKSSKQFVTRLRTENIEIKSQRQDLNPYNSISARARFS